VLPSALTYRPRVDLHAGDCDTACALDDEAAAFTSATGNAPLAYTSLVLAAWRGEEDRAVALFEAARADARFRGEGRTLTMAAFSAAVLCNGLGRYSDALAHAQEACEHDELGLFGWTLVELVEAAARSGEHDAAVRACEQLAGRTRPSAGGWARGVEARSRALVADGDAAEELYLEAIERLGGSRIKVHLARARLVYGEWLRREGRRLDARAQLRAAHEQLAAMGAEAFAERARRELLATGEKARTRTPDTRGRLTPQEMQIALLARDGLSNPEIGARLFVSPRTVEYHLHKVFAKLGIASRTELHLVLDEAARDAPALAGPAAAGAPHLAR
jgi:DNA-binding CsgD family transcriptional regulator